MRTLTEGTITATLNFGQNLFLQERAVIDVTINDTSETANNVALLDYFGAIVATYQTNAQHRVIIDATDLIRAQYATDSRLNEISIYHEAGDSMLQISYNVAGLINYRKIFVPYNERAAAIGAGIVPPSLVLNHKGAKSLIFQTFAPVGVSHGMRAYIEGQPQALTAGEFGAYEIPENASAVDMYSSVRVGTRPPIVTYTNKIVFVEPVCSAEIAVLRWVGFNGGVKVAAFYVKGVNFNTENGVNLQPAAFGDYSYIKGREDGCTLYLDGLTMYDYFYYADIVTSSRVEMQTTQDGSHVFTPVSVEDTGVTLPSGDAGKTNTLEVKIKFAKYGAFTM